MLSLDRQCVKTMLIKTFGSDLGSKQLCDVVSLCLSARNGGAIQLLFLSVPMICDPLSDQSIAHAMENYEYLTNLDLADYSCATDLLEVDILIGSDHYWKPVTGEVVRSGDGPMAIQTKFGWVLSGPVQELSCESTSCNLVTTHTLIVDTYALDDSEHRLENRLKTFWDLESFGIKEGEPDVYG